MVEEVGVGLFGARITRDVSERPTFYTERSDSTRRIITILRGPRKVIFFRTYTLGGRARHRKEHSFQKNRDPSLIDCRKISERKEGNA